MTAVMTYREPDETQVDDDGRGQRYIWLGERVGDQARRFTLTIDHSTYTKLLTVGAYLSTRQHDTARDGSEMVWESRAFGLAANGDFHIELSRQAAPRFNRRKLEQLAATALPHLRSGAYDHVIDAECLAILRGAS